MYTQQQENSRTATETKNSNIGKQQQKSNDNHSNNETTIKKTLQEVCAGLIFASLIPFFLGSIFATLIFGFLAAGLVYALYSIGLAMLSRRFSGAEIVAANAGFVILFELSNLMGPWVAGFLLDINMRLGLPIFTISIGVFYLTISWIRRHTNANY